MNIQNQIELFESSVKESFYRYKQFGPRSSKKILPIHQWVGELLQDVFGDEYVVWYASGDKSNKEYVVSGAFNKKRVDITVVKKSSNEPIFCVGVKFITRNYKQNSNNYFETMIGETANIQRLGLPYAHLIVMRDNTPYYKRNGSVTKVERITMNDISKYFELISGKPESIIPYSIAVPFFHIDEENGNCAMVEPNDMHCLNNNSAKFGVIDYEQNLSIKNFIHKIISYKNGGI